MCVRHRRRHAPLESRLCGSSVSTVTVPVAIRKEPAAAIATVRFRTIAPAARAPGVGRTRGARLCQQSRCQHEVEQDKDPPDRSQLRPPFSGPDGPRCGEMSLAVPLTDSSQRRNVQSGWSGRLRPRLSPTPRHGPDHAGERPAPTACGTAHCTFGRRELSIKWRAGVFDPGFGLGSLGAGISCRTVPPATFQKCD